LKTLLAVALACGAWRGGAWAQGMLGLEWLGLLVPAGAVVLSLGVLARALREH